MYKSVDKPWSGKLCVQATDVSRKGKEFFFEPLDICAGLFQHTTKRAVL